MPKNYSVGCDCEAVALLMSGEPNVHAYYHCDDCRNLLQVPYYSVIAWNPEGVEITKGQEDVIEFQHPHKRMTRVFCAHSGDVLYNTIAMGWKLVSQLLIRRCNEGELPQAFESGAHFFYGCRVIDVDDLLPKSGSRTTGFITQYPVTD